MANNRIAALRRENSMNQRELGEKLGVGQTTVSAWETGKNEPDNESMNAMAQMFRVSIGYLMGFENNEKTRGLTQKQIEEYNKQDYIQDIVNKYERQEEEARQPFSTEELKRIAHDELLAEWNTTDRKTYPEAYAISKMMEDMDRQEREYIVTMVSAANALRKH